MATILSVTNVTTDCFSFMNVTTDNFYCKMWPRSIFINVATILSVTNVTTDFFLFHECDYGQFLLQNVAKEYFYKCGHYSFSHECDY